MVVVKIQGISVDFPFQPYDVQKKYMEKVIECLCYGCNGALESPTGTGKTLSLLCASLAYIENYKNQIGEFMKSVTGDKEGAPVPTSPKLIYSMRTHTQVAHAFNEFLRTGYKKLKATVIGSRDQLCLNPEVATESNKSIKINLCRAKVNSKSCHFYNNVESTVAATTKLTNDIEDLMELGRKNRCCPYYLSRNLARDADVVFMPYNYLLDAKASKFIDINIEGNIVIFDEAHNVEQLCETAASTELKSKDIAVAINEVTSIMQSLAHMNVSTEDTVGSFDDAENKIDFELKDVCCVKSMLCEMETQLDSIQLDNEGNATLSVPEILQFMAKTGITRDNNIGIVAVMERMVNYLSNAVKNVGMRKGAALQKCADMITLLFQTNESQELLMHKDSTSYKIHVALDDGKKSTDVWTLAKKNKPKILNVWCFNPGVRMKPFLAKNPKCVIFTSGTLSPLLTFVSEMQIPIPITLQNGHIIDKSQLHVGVIPKGPDGLVLNSSYRNRSDLKYILSLGRSIANFSQIIPGGVLVFFPSYFLMNECIKKWEQHDLWSSLGRTKKIFVEPQGQDISQLMEEYYKVIREPKSRGAIMMAVCRGKVSEGIDFADDNGRCVIITGLPFRPWKDPKVIGKMDYVSSQFKNNRENGLNGKDWYDLEAARAVNQAIGRVIRHKDDYATILFLDERFNYQKYQSQLSTWVKPFITNHTSFGTAIRDISNFFRPRLPSDSNSVKIHKLLTAAKDQCPSVEPETKSVKQMTIDELEHEVMLLKKFYTSDVKEKPSGSASSTSLFSALESAPSSAPKFLNKLPAAIEPPSTSTNCEEIKRKKLKVMNPRQTYEMTAVTAAEKPIESETETKKPMSAELMLKKIKSLLSMEQYKIFSFAIKKFHTGGNIQDLCESFVSICTTKDIHKNILAFDRIIPVSKREEFKKILLNSKLLLKLEVA